MSVPASPRRATYDAIALAIAFLAVDGFVIATMLAGWLEISTGVAAILALAAVVLLLYRDDVTEAITAGNRAIGLGVDEEPARRELDALAGEGWEIEHDVSNARGMLIGTLVQGPAGAYIVEFRNRAYRLEHLRRARRDAAWLHGPVGAWVTPIICLAVRDDQPHCRSGVWIMGAEHLAGWLRSRLPRRESASG
jgi:hypothetical protein